MHMYHSHVSPKMSQIQCLCRFIRCLSENTLHWFQGYLLTWHGNALDVTGPLWGESLDHQRITLITGQNVELQCFLCCLLPHTVEQTVELLVISGAMTFIWHCCDGWTIHKISIKLTIFNYFNFQAHLAFRAWILMKLMVCLTHCALMTPYGDIDLGQHWLRQWLVAWWHQAIAWTNVDLPSKCSVAFTWEHFHKKCSWTSSYHVFIDCTFKLLPHLPGTNELT